MYLCLFYRIYQGAQDQSSARTLQGQTSLIRSLEAKRESTCPQGDSPSTTSRVNLRTMSVYLEHLCQRDFFQLEQVNEYPAGVGLSPHIDTHSAFQGCILSLSLAGPCVMEFRRYTNEAWSSQKMDIGFARGRLNNDISGMKGTAGKQQQGSKQRPQFERKAIFLPSRSLLVLSEEARYAWHHYIPHHKVDIINGERICRSSRRVSFTFRKVRFGPCDCRFQQYCDSQSQVIDSLGQPELKTANNREQKQGIACLEE